MPTPSRRTLGGSSRTVRAMPAVRGMRPYSWARSPSVCLCSLSTASVPALGRRSGRPAGLWILCERHPEPGRRRDATGAILPPDPTSLTPSSRSLPAPSPDNSNASCSWRRPASASPSSPQSSSGPSPCTPPDHATVDANVRGSGVRGPPRAGQGSGVRGRCLWQGLARCASALVGYHILSSTHLPFAASRSSVAQSSKKSRSGTRGVVVVPPPPFRPSLPP